MTNLREIEYSFLSDIFKESIIYFESSQNPDGGFPYNDVGSPSGIWNTSGILWSLIRLCRYRDTPFLKDAVKYLFRNQNEDGSLSMTYKEDRSCVDGTAHFIMALNVIYRENKNLKILKRIESAALWLSKISKNGSYGFFPDSEPVISSTTFALKALNYVKDILDHPDIIRTIKAGVEWLLLNRNADFGWGIYPNMPSKSCSTAYALDAIIECYCDIDTIKDEIESGIKIVLNGQQESGNWQDIIERRAGLTIIRIGTPPCLITLLKYGTYIYSTSLQKGIKYLISNFSSGKVTYQDSDIVTWSTRDALLALSELRNTIVNREILDIFDKNIKSEKEILELKLEIKQQKENLESRIQEEKKQYYDTVKSKYEKLVSNNKFFRNLNAFLILCILGIICLTSWNLYNISTEAKISIVGIIIAFWVGLLMFIKSNNKDGSQ
jgi:Squalene cyclase